VVGGTTINEAPIKKVITAHSACIRRLRVVGIRLTARRAAPWICGSARKSDDASRR
jgi:hypothetical protein